MKAPIVHGSSGYIAAGFIVDAMSTVMPVEVLQVNPNPYTLNPKVQGLILGN